MGGLPFDDEIDGAVVELKIRAGHTYVISGDGEGAHSDPEDIFQLQQVVDQALELRLDELLADGAGEAGGAGEDVVDALSSGRRWRCVGQLHRQGDGLPGAAAHTLERREGK